MASPTTVDLFGVDVFGNGDNLARSSKRRRLDSSYSHSPSNSSVADSGYNSEETDSEKSPPSLDYEQSMLSATNDSANKRRRVNSEPALSTKAPAQFIERYISRMHPADRQRYARTKPNPPSFTTRDADREILEAQQQIAAARKRLYSFSGSSAPSAEQDKSTAGWTSGPKAAESADLFDRMFHTISMTNHERSLFNNLTEPVREPQSQSLPLNLSAEDKREVEQQVHFAGLAMPVDLDDEELDYEPDTYNIEAVDGGFDDFFKLDEASTPSEEVAGSPP